MINRYFKVPSISATQMEMLEVASADYQEALNPRNIGNQFYTSEEERVMLNRNNDFIEGALWMLSYYDEFISKK